jgi:hypothetical protein
MHKRDEMPPTTRADVDAPAFHGPNGPTLSFDGSAHFLTATGGAWEVRFELEQLGAGELLGVGSVWTPAHPGHPLLGSEVLVSGRVDEHGTATLFLVPIAASTQAPVTLLVRMAERSDVQDPLVSEVLDVQGLPR